MKLRTLLVASWLLLSAGLAAAQSTAADAISGTWTGTMGPSESDQNAITVTLKLDGKTLTGLITGPPHPGDITGGSFDPETGALRLDVVVRDDDKTRVVFEGKVVKGTASGTVAFRNQKGTFKITKEAAGQARRIGPPPTMGALAPARKGS